MDAELKPKTVSGLKIGKFVDSYERQKLLGTAEVNVHKIIHMIEQNDEDLNILKAILSLDKVLARLELSLLEDWSDRQMSSGRSAGRGKKDRTRAKAPARRKSYNNFDGYTSPVI
ncbi:MAG TPA: hypothetical protein ENI27_04580 [bacterium]|nr:hypothetical protein [bacterium]